MEDSKRRFDIPRSRDAVPDAERRRASRIVHDHKGTSSVQWVDVPRGLEDRVPLEIEGAREPASDNAGGPRKGGLHTGSLEVKAEDTFNPYTRIPENAHKGTSTSRTDLRKLSAWIKLMRQLEERKRDGNDDQD
jgi:hypothetical protein